MSDLEVLAVNTDFEADRKTVAKICKAYDTFLPSERWILQLLVSPPYCQVYGARTLYMMRIKQHGIAGGPLLQ